MYVQGTITPSASSRVSVDQRLRQLSLPAPDLDAVRLEHVTFRAVLAQRLPLRDEHAQRLLQ
jgi:hypothetical protein